MVCCCFLTQTHVNATLNLGTPTHKYTLNTFASSRNWQNTLLLTFLFGKPKLLFFLPSLFASHLLSLFFRNLSICRFRWLPLSPSFLLIFHFFSLLPIPPTTTTTTTTKTTLTTFLSSWYPSRTCMCVRTYVCMGVIRSRAPAHYPTLSILHDVKHHVFRGPKDQTRDPVILWDPIFLLQNIRGGHS